jgi:hypothetical protein
MALHTVVLRFADFNNVETISEHLKIIAESPSHTVWWGWWKKDDEAPKGGALRALGRRIPTMIGLINRVAKKYYMAQCARVEVGPRGARINSPAPEFTPLYYRDSAHPAWFELSAIAEISEEEFVKQFAGIPQGDPTFYIVDKTESGFVLQDEDFSDPDLIKTKGDSILHLSDLHFGPDHAAFPTKSTTYPIPKLSLADKVTEIVQARKDYKIGVVVISGDLLTRGEEQGWNVAEIFLETLLKNLKLEKEHVVITPGNHDIHVKDYQSAPYSYEPERPYRRFLKSFFGITEGIERLQRFLTPSKWQLRFLSLNSVSLRNKEHMDYGFIGKDRYEPFLKILDDSNQGQSAAKLAQQKILNFAVFHHHILPVQGIEEPVPEGPISIMLDAGQLVANFQSSQIHFALHGHQHVPFVGTTARACRVGNTWSGYDKPVTVIGCGSTGVKADRLADVMRENSLGIYTPHGRTLEVRVERFNPTIPAETYMKLSLRL